jgi:Sulfotransferase domain
MTASQAASRTTRETPLPRRAAGKLRVAVLSTPRSGNTWLRHLLMQAYDAVGIVVFSPTEVDWSALPERCVLQVHWPRRPSFLERLEEYGFQIVALARHPLDVLISILHFALHHSTARWLEGEGGNEASILGAMPGSAAFQEYACGPRATALLDVTRQWWQAAGSYRLHFEDLVADPGTQLDTLVDHLGFDPRASLASAIESTSLDKLRAFTQAPQHFWQGKPGLWRRLFTAADARAIYLAHEELFAELGYECNPDLDLSAAQADANWIQLNWSALADSLQNQQICRHTVRQLEARLEAAQHQMTALREQMAGLEEQLRICQPCFDEVAEFKNWLTRLGMTWDRVKVLGPASLSLAQKLHYLSMRVPLLSRTIKILSRAALVHSQ